MVAEQVVDLMHGDYTMAYSYHTSDIPPATGIRWQILDAKSNTVIAESPDLSSDGLQNSALRSLFQRTIRFSGCVSLIGGLSEHLGFLVCSWCFQLASKLTPSHDLSTLR